MLNALMIAKSACNFVEKPSCCATLAWQGLRRGEDKMLSRFAVVLVIAALAVPASSQTRSSPPPKAAPQPQPIPRAVFLKNMDSEFAALDINHDGKATKAEIETAEYAKAMREILARNRQIFQELDKDRNGQLSPAEFAQFHAAPPRSNAVPMLQKFDANRDGIISQVEFRGATLSNFDKLDTDKDGIVTAAEMSAGGIRKH
jgi:Ca2+-binding EF-hand superfamily protein